MYLVTGVVHKIRLSKDRLQKATLEEITISLNKTINLSKYSLVEDATQYTWELNPENLCGNALLAFLQAQHAKYNQEKINNFNDAMIPQLSGKSGNDVIQMVHERSFRSHLQKIDIYDYVSIPAYYDPIKLTYTLFAFFSDGKIIMECYNNILSYFSQLVHLQAKEYAIADCVKVAITP